MKVFLGSTELKDSATYPLKSIGYQEPLIEFNSNINKLYTISMFDIDAPNRNDPGKADWLHMLKVNNNDVLAKYTPPSPPFRSGPHRYYIQVCEQSGPIMHIKISDRKKFSASKFIAQQKLKVVCEFMFMVENA